jgi:glyoxylase-like metal-dependent hydrolase (beta-lactamase superfamily II)
VISIEARRIVKTAYHHFQLGSLKCLALSDGSVNYPPGHLFANVSKARVEEALRGRGGPVDYITTPCTCLCVDTGAHRVLVDMGAGKAAPGTGHLRPNLAAAGVEPASIDTVIITHAHPAHVGGTLDDEGRPVYANARYYLWADEWAFWTSAFAFAKASERHVSLARANLEPIRDQLTLLDREGEIVPGICALPAPGHTPGHAVVSLSSGNECLLYVGDLGMHLLHLEHPDWSPIYDIAPGQAKASKRRILNRAAEGEALVMGHHLSPFPSLGHVLKKGDAWQWRPIDVG